MVATFAKSSGRNTWISLRPPTVTYANVPRALRAKLTWLVIGPVSSVASTANGGRAANTMTLPTSFSVNHTWLPSGVAAMLGQNRVSTTMHVNRSQTLDVRRCTSGSKDELEITALTR